MRLFEHVQRLQELGLQIALGQGLSGFSSIASLLIIEPRFIKIEKHVVKSCSDNQSIYRDFVAKLAGVASGLDCRLIAEGIESKKDLDAISSCGVELGQGPFWGLPIQID